MIILKKSHYKEILNHSFSAVPNEACGLLGGRTEGDLKTVERVYLLTNVDSSPEHFSMDPKEQFNAIKDMRSNGWVILGNFHSHPASPSRPSEEDKRLAFDIQASYMIISLSVREQPVLRSFKIVGNTVSEEEIRIIGNY